VGILVPVALVLQWWFLPSIPGVSADEVKAIEVHLVRFHQINESDPNNRQIEARLKTTDPAKIQALLDVFKGAERASDHKCGNSGTIRIIQKDGSVEELGILPGHDSAYYEYRYGSRINRVEREPFLAALKAIGVRQILLSPPS
jgi:hypothetical protein